MGRCWRVALAAAAIGVVGLAVTGQAMDRSNGTFTRRRVQAVHVSHVVASSASHADRRVQPLPDAWLPMYAAARVIWVSIATEAATSRNNVDVPAGYRSRAPPT